MYWSRHFSFIHADTSFIHALCTNVVSGSDNERWKSLSLMLPSQSLKSFVSMASHRSLPNVSSCLFSFLKRVLSQPLSYQANTPYVAGFSALLSLMAGCAGGHT